MTRPEPAPAALVVGGSAGALGPLVDLVRALPADLPAAVLVTMHVGEHFPSRLPLILGRAGRLPVARAEEGEPVRAGQVYVAPPGRHLLVGASGLGLSAGPRVNRHRPAIDVMFAGAAATMGARTVAVVLSGVLDDGAVGAALVAREGGQVLVQADAEFSSMPSAALRAAPGAREVGRAGLPAAVLAGLEHVSIHAAAPPKEANRMTEDAADATWDRSMARSGDVGFLAEGETRLTRLTCPECNGAMAQVDLPQISYFACHVGHRYSPQSLAAAQSEAAEARLWTAVAALEEQAAVLAYLRETGQPVPGAEDPEAWSETVSRRAVELRRRAREWSAAPVDTPRAG